jgi:hypothetical protein
LERPGGNRSAFLFALKLSGCAHQAAAWSAGGRLFGAIVNESTREDCEASHAEYGPPMITRSRPILVSAPAAVSDVRLHLTR